LPSGGRVQTGAIVKKTGEEEADKWDHEICGIHIVERG